MQKEITKECALIEEDGKLNVGYARHLYFQYDKSKIRAKKIAVKEWDFYQINCGEYILQLTIGHVSYCGQAGVTLFSTKTGERWGTFRLFPFPKKLKAKMEVNGEKPHVLRAEQGDFSMTFTVNENERILEAKGKHRKGDINIRLHLANCSKEKEKMVISTPFENPNQFYLNYKENCYDVTGNVEICGKKVEFGKYAKAYGLLDWGRGVWPFHQLWTWGNGSTKVDGKYFGFNIGWGFGDLSNATENMFFYDNVAYKLGVVSMEEKDGKQHYTDEDGLFDFWVEPVFDNFTKTKVLHVDNSCHQVFGKWHGKVTFPNGDTLEVPEFLAFCENADNRW